MELILSNECKGKIKVMRELEVLKCQRPAGVRIREIGHTGYGGQSMEFVILKLWRGYSS